MVAGSQEVFNSVPVAGSWYITQNASTWLLCCNVLKEILFIAIIP